MKKLKTYVITVSQNFPKTHKRNGQETGFSKKILGLSKLHTIRGNYPLWEKRFEEIKKGNAILSLRYWSGKPYKSKQVEFLQLDKECGIGIQKVYVDLKSTMVIKDTFALLVKLEQIAGNDGLSLEDFKEWFKGSIHAEPMVIIHFTHFRY